MTRRDGERSDHASLRLPRASTWAVVVLAGLTPAIMFLAGNLGSGLHSGALVKTTLVILGVEMVVLAGLCVLARRWDPDGVGYGVSLIVLSTFSASAWLDTYRVDAGGRALEWGLFLLVTGAVAVLAYRVAAHPQVRSFVLLFLLIIDIIGVAQVAVYERESSSSPSVAVDVPTAPPAKIRPDIYWFVLDEYGRSDQVRRYTGYDNSAFLGDLGSRGFTVFPAARASYVVTQLSIASTLSMDYVWQPGGSFRDEFDAAGPVFQGDSSVVRRFRSHGYRYLYAPSGVTSWAGCLAPPADRCAVPSASHVGLDDVATSLLYRTPLALTDLFDELQMTPEAAWMMAEDERGAGPFFLFAHVMSPHWPVRYADDCSRLPRSLNPQWFDASERARRYALDVRCLGDDVVRVVDEITAADPGAIVILQGDHGNLLTATDLRLDVGEWTQVNLDERLSPLNAIRMPTECTPPDNLESQQLVNTFRLVFACIEGRQPDLLAYRAFVSSYQRLDDLREIDPATLHNDRPE